MQVLVFRTNIRYKKHVIAIEHHIAQQPGIIKWNVDLKDVDKVLRIETADIHPSKIERIIKEAGHICEELKD